MNRKLANEELDRPTLEEYGSSDKIPVVIVLDNVRSAFNVGSIFRTADAFSLDAICLCGITAQPPHREIRKTALGAERSVKWQYHKETESAVIELKAGGYRVLVVEQTTISIALEELEVDVSRPLALVFGNEVNGVDQSIVDLADGTVEIPQAGTKHSLNVGVSVGVVAWEVFRKTKKAAL